MKEVIMQVPSFSADYPKTPIYVADLVRCKECRWGKPYSDKQLECDALGLGGLKFPDNFCSYGQKGDENVETD